MSVRRDNARVFSAEEKEEIVANFREGLDRLVGRAQAAGVKVVLVTVPANLRQWNPEASTGMASLSEADRQTWSKEFESSRRQLNAADFAAAAVNLEKAPRLAPDHAETQFFLAQAYEGLARWDDARDAYWRACDVDASPTRRLSGINEAIRDVAREQRTLLVDADQSFEQRSEHGLAGFNLIEDYVHPTREGHEIIAWYIYDAIARAGWLGSETPAKRELFDALVAERRRRPVTNDTNAVWFYNQGVVLENQGNAEAAIEKYRQSLALAPNSDLTMLNLGVLLNQAGLYGEAEAVFQRMIEIHPMSSKAHNNLGNALAGLGRFEEAVAHYKKALRIKPNDPFAHNNLGNMLLAMERFAEAIPHFEDALRIEPDFAEPHNNLGLSMQSLDRFEEAVAHYQDALRLNPGYAMAHNNLGNALLELGRSEEAMKHYDKALQLAPDSAEIQNNFGLALQKSGRTEESLAHYQEALRLRPDFSEAHYNLGHVLRTLRRLEEAVAHYQDASRLKPDDVEIHNSLAGLLATYPEASIRDGPLAVKHAERAARLTKLKDAAVLDTLSATYAEVGAFRKAVRSQQRAVQLAPDSQKDDLRQRLELYRAQ
ncbi:MAG: tetratricopeptide repeat protein [Pirellulales bacterium]